jgi:hypothetical protein
MKKLSGCCEALVFIRTSQLWGILICVDFALYVLIRDWSGTPGVGADEELKQV